MPSPAAGHSGTVASTSLDAGAEIAEGAFLNLFAVLASSLRGIFTFLIARLLGKAALGTFALAWATTDLLSKIGTFGLESGAIALVARSEARGDRQQSRRVLQSSAVLGVVISGLTAAAGIL